MQSSGQRGESTLRSEDERLRSVARAQAAVADLGRRALEGAEADELMQAAVETVLGMLDVDFAAVFELLPGGGTLQVRAAAGWDEAVVGQLVPGGTSSQAGFTVAEAQPVVVEDMAAEQRFTEDEIGLPNEIRSGITVPLRAREQPFGVLAAHSRRPRSFVEDDVILLRSAANVLAAAIQRSRNEASLRRANSLLHAVLEGSADAVFVKNLDGRYLLINAAGARVMGLAPYEVVGRTAADVFPAEAAAAIERNDRQVIAQGSPRTFEEVIPGDGVERTFLSTKSPYLGGDRRVAGIIGIARDITQRKRDEERQRFLAQASALLDASLDPSQTLQTIAALAVPAVADLCVIDLVQEDGPLRGVAVAGADPELSARLEKLRARYPVSRGGSHPVARVLRHGKAELFPKLESMYEQIAQSDEHMEFARAAGYRSALVAPLTARGRTLGAISLIRYRTAERYREDDLELARDLGRRAAMALDNARLYAHEHDVSETLQRSLLPQSIPDVPGLRFAPRYVPGGPGIEVGGDWYDVIPLTGGRVGLAIGDVAGRGLRAATIMGQLRTTLRVFCSQSAAPAEVLAGVDRVFQRLEEGELATLVFLTLDPASGSVHYSVAAHPPPLVRSPDGEAHYLEEGRGLPLGVAPAYQFPEASSRVPPGSTLLIYTDGLIERSGESIDDGLERLRRVTATAPVEADDLADHVLAEMLVDSDRLDDVALLAINMAPVPERLHFRLPGEPQDLSRLREEMRVWLGRHDVDLDPAQDITLACSEAAANAIEHAYGKRDGPIEVQGRRDGATVLTSIRDFGRWRPRRTRMRGRGLAVIDALMDQVEIVKGEAWTEVRMARRIDGGRSG